MTHGEDNRAVSERGEVGHAPLELAPLEALLELSERLLESETVSELYEAMASALGSATLLAARRVVVLEGDADSEVLFAVWSNDDELEGSRWLRSARLERVLAGQIIALKDASSTLEVSELSPGVTIKAALYLPIGPSRVVVACHSERAHFERAHVVIAARVAPLISHKARHLAQQQMQMQRLRLEGERRVMREQFLLIKHAARSLGAGVAVLDTQGALRERSEALAELVTEWGTSQAWWDLARRVLSETPITGSEAIGEAGDARETRHVAKRTVDMDDPRGVRRVFELTFTGTPHRFEDGELGHVLLVADVTRWVLAEDALIDARDESERASRAKSRFLANMSHELRTPLNAIIGYSEMLIEESAQIAGDLFREDLERIDMSARQLLSLINDVLDLSKIEADRLEIEPSSFSLTSLLDEVESTIHPLIRKGSNRFVRTERDAPATIHSDRDKLRQVLLNLLANAAKFTEKGMISLSATSAFEGSGRWLEVRIVDTGIGIPEDKIKRLFTPFEQVDPSATRRYGGTGLGLAISQRLCQMLGGRIEVESALGVGSTFIVRLPLLHVSASDQGDALSR